MTAITAIGPTLVGTALAKLNDEHYRPKLQDDGHGRSGASAMADEERCGNVPRPPFPHTLLGFDLSAIHPSLADVVAHSFLR